MISMHPYAKLFADGSVRYLYAASVVGRLPIGMCGLAILLLVQGARGSFAAAGATTGAYVAGLAVIAPALGKFIDRRGPRAALLVCSLLFPASLAALIAAVLDAASAALVFACAAAAGATFPPITVCMRTFLRQRFAEEAALVTAYSVDSVLIEVMFIAGPMLVALLVAVASPAIAVGCAAACAFVGVQLFLRSAALREWRIERRTATSLLGPLGERRFIALVMIVACYAIAFGLTEIGTGVRQSALARSARTPVQRDSGGDGRGLAAAGIALAHRSLWSVLDLGRDCHGAGADHPIDARRQDGVPAARDGSFHLGNECVARGRRDRDGAWRSARGVLAITGCVLRCRGGRDRRGRSRVSAARELGGEPLVHAPATGVERRRRVRAELFKKLVVRLELVLPRR